MACAPHSLWTLRRPGLFRPPPPKIPESGARLLAAVPKDAIPSAGSGKSPGGVKGVASVWHSLGWEGHHIPSRPTCDLVFCLGTFPKSWNLVHTPSSSTPDSLLALRRTGLLSRPLLKPWNLVRASSQQCQRTQFHLPHPAKAQVAKSWSRPLALTRLGGTPHSFPPNLRPGLLPRHLPEILESGAHSLTNAKTRTPSHES